MAIRPGRSKVFVNIHETYPGDFTRDADFTLPSRRLVSDTLLTCGSSRAASATAGS